ncbi:MAG TPA: hypothetical protein VGD56_04140, partial [Gemmatirosa sp.]
AARPFNAALALALVAIGRGVVRTADVGPNVALDQCVIATGWGTRRVEDWRRGLRGIAAMAQTPAGRAALNGCPALATLAAQLATLDGLTPRAAPRTLEQALAELDASLEPGAPADDVPDAAAADVLPADLTAGQRAMLERLRTHAPHVYDFVLCPRVSPSGETEPLRAATIGHVLECVDHLLAAYLRVRPLLADVGAPVYTLRDLTPAALVHVRVPARLLTIPPPAVRYRPGVVAMLSQTAFGTEVGPNGVEQTVPLLHLLLDRQVEASRAHSPAIAHPALGAGAPGGASGYTQALRASARNFQHALDRWLQTTTYPGTPERAHLVGLLDAARRVAHDVAVGVARCAPCKQPTRLLALVTLPQLICVGLPRLTAYLLAAYRGYCVAGRAHDLPPDFTLLVESCFTTAVFAADTLRDKNLRNARFGHEVRVVRTGTGANAVITSVHTRFTGFGGDNPSAALKIKHEWVADASGRRRRRERVREHRWSPAIVTPELWQLALAVRDAKRPRDGAARDAQSSGATPHGSPLLTATTNPGRRLSRKSLRARVARVLHWVCREVLGRTLPAWTVFCRTRGRDYYGLFGSQVLRALQATYWLGVRERDVIGAGLSAADRRRLRAAARPGFDAFGVDTAVYGMHQMNDVKATLETSYVHLTAEAAARRCTSPDTMPWDRRWEHERAYDTWMDRVALGDEIVWHRQIGLPLPPGLRLSDLAPGGA